MPAINFLNPAALLYSLLIIPLILLYLLKQEKMLIEVPSLIPWIKLDEEYSVARKEFRVELLFVLQLIFVLSLTLGLARFFIIHKVKGEYKVLIISVSASMQTRDQEGQTRLESAKRKARKVIEGMGDQDKVMLVQAGNPVRILSSFAEQKPELLKKLDSIKGEETSANLGDALRSALSAANDFNDCKFYLFTDKYDKRLADISGAQPLNFQIIGSPSANNVAITDLKVYQGLYYQSQPEAYVVVRNYSSKPQSPRLQLSLDDRLQWENTLNLDPGENLTVPFGGIGKPGILRADLVIQDDLAADNQAYALARPHKTARLLLVSGQGGPLSDIRRVCQKIQGLEVSLIKPVQYSPRIAENFDMAVFHHFVPASPPGISSLYIMPPANPVVPGFIPGNSGGGQPDSLRRQSPALRSAQIIPCSGIQDWDRLHAITKYLGFLDKVPVDKMLPLEVPDWAAGLIQAREGTLAWAGEYRNHRLACFGFELEKYLFPPSEDISVVVLLLNTLDWLDDSSVSGQIKTGQRYFLKLERPLRSAKIITPAGERIPAELTENGLSFDQTQQAGVYEVIMEDQRGRMRTGKFAANLLDEGESQITPIPAPAPSGNSIKTAPVSAAGSLREERKEFWPYMVMAAILILLAEWWTYLRELW